MSKFQNHVDKHEQTHTQYQNAKRRKPQQRKTKIEQNKNENRYHTVGTVLTLKEKKQ